MQMQQNFTIHPKHFPNTKHNMNNVSVVSFKTAEVGI